MAELVVTAAGGMVGRAVVACLARAGRGFQAWDRAGLDITSTREIRERIAPGTRVVVNCAAWADVDGAESHRDDAMRINAEGPALLADRCREISALLVHISTDYVFDGQAVAPYRVDHVHAPINVYGESKAAGERRLRDGGADHLIVRTSWVYAPWGKNFVQTIARLAREREQLRVVDDQRGRPTSALHLAQSLLALVDREVRGTFHVTDGGECTWFDLATETARRIRPECAVVRCKTGDFPTAARRPRYSVLDISATESLLGSMPSWQENLERVLTSGSHV